MEEEDQDEQDMEEVSKLIAQRDEEAKEFKPAQDVLNKLANIKYTRSSYEKWRHNEVGLYFAAGFLVAVMDDVSIDIGIKYKMSFINAYDNINKYKTTQALITIGITYRFMKKLF